MSDLDDVIASNAARREREREQARAAAAKPPGWSIEQHPRDLRPGRYDALLGSFFPPDTQRGSDHARHTWRTGSPHIIVPFDCPQCGRTGVFYGRQDHLPDDHHCDRCRRRAQAGGDR